MLIKSLLLLLSYNQVESLVFNREVCVWPKKFIFSSGPGTCNTAIKKAMLEDHASTEKQMFQLIMNLRKQLLLIAGVSDQYYAAAVFQGSTTFAIEAAVNSCSPKGGKWLILSNGFYGKHMENIALYSGKNFFTLEFPETQVINPNVVEKHLQKNRGYTAVGLVHMETTSGSMNDIATLGKIVHRYIPAAFFVVDAATTFGGMPIDMTDVDFLITCPNKAIASPPGVGIVIAKKSALARMTDGHYSFVLDLGRQFQNPLFNTMPYEILTALNVALDILIKEGGVRGRGERLKKLNVLIRQGLKKLGFQEFLNPSISNYLINTYKFPTPDFKLNDFVNCLEDSYKPKYVFRMSRTMNFTTFRIGNMGQLTPDDVTSFLTDVKRCIKVIGCKMPVYKNYENFNQPNFYF